jgi:CRP-like cAMP-binding protein
MRTERGPDRPCYQGICQPAADSSSLEINALVNFCRLIRRFDGDVRMQASGSGRGFWDLLPAEDRRFLRALGQDREYPPGTTMCVEGDPATHVFILLDGWVRVLSVTEDGRESTVALRGAGEIVGESAGATSGERNATIQALAVVHALIVRYDRFSSFLDARPGAGHAYRRMMTYRWNDAETALRTYVVTSGAQRLAGLLLGLAERLDGQAGGAIEIVLPLSQEELAGLVGTSRATVTRALDGWRRRGLIRTGQRRITLIDVPGLHQAAGPAAPLRD